MSRSSNSDPVLNLYRAAKTINNLANINIEYLRGNIDKTLLCHGPLNPDSLPLVDDLVVLSQMGCVSISGQSGECSYNTWYDNLENGKGYESIEQKAYIECLLSKKYKYHRV